ncbi:putative XK-related protein [Trypoxylus dichotomus]
MIEPTAPVLTTESQPNDYIVNDEGTQNESSSCWGRTKAKINFAWTYIKPPVAYIWDVIIDIYRTVYYFLQREFVVGGISAGIIIIALLASMKYKWQMNNKEYNRRSSDTTAPSVEDQSLNPENRPMQPSLQEPTLREKILNSIVLVWYWRKLREAWTSGTLKSKNTYMIDTSLLGILENFLENGPQLNLTWFYVFWIKEEITFVPSIVMKSISLLVLTWSIPSYIKAVKRSRGEENLTKCNMLMLFLWNVLQIVPKILLISIFAAEHPIPALIYLPCHVALMIVLLLFVAEENPNLLMQNTVPVLVNATIWINLQN